MKAQEISKNIDTLQENIDAMLVAVSYTHLDVYKRQMELL